MSTSPLISATERRSLVLVADDEQAIQDLLANVIQRLGLAVICVGDGAAAIAAVEAYRDKLICAIMDIVMPVVNGVDAAHAIQATAPGLPIVLMSGAIPDAYMDSITQLRLAALLAKPFSVAPVRDLLRHAVGDSVALEKEGTNERQL
jgi:CheY-like chemotaxis protein